MKMRVKWLEEPEKRRKARSAPPDKRKKESEHPDHPMEPQEQMQRAYGNAAFGQMVQSLLAREDVASALSSLAPPYNELAMRLIGQAAAEGDQERIRQFLALSSGQRLAALQAAAAKAGANRGSPLSRMEKTDLDHLDYGIQSVTGVRLKEDEPEQEGDAADSGAKPQEPVTADVNGLLPPYKEIVLWLTYKANRQGKQEIMRSFSSLTVPEKKWAIRLMASKKKKSLEFKAFTEAMAVQVQLKEWVDWDTVSGALQKTKEMTERLDKQQAAALFEDEDAAIPDWDEDEDAMMPDFEEDEESDAGASLAGLLGAAAFGASALMDGGDEASRQEERDAVSAIAPDKAGWLLLGLTQAVPAHKAISDFCKSRKDPKAVVDRYLQVPMTGSDKSRENIRNKLLKKWGFHSIEQCYTQIMNEVAKWIFEGGVIRQEREYLRLLADLGLPVQKGQSPDPAAIVRKLTG